MGSLADPALGCREVLGAAGGAGRAGAVAMATSGREWIPLSRAWEGWGQAGAEATAPRAEEEQAESLIAKPGW